MKHFNRQKNKGVYTVEFTLVSALFLLTIFMVMEGIRYMYLMNAASEITRRGARLAIVCNMNAPGILSEMAARYPNLDTETNDLDMETNVVITYSPAGCNQSNCQTVTVRLTGLSTTIIGVTANIPSFVTTLPRESMNSALNPACA